MKRGVIVKCFMLFLITDVSSMVFGNEMCDETPHPGECKTLLIKHKPIRSTTQFLQVSVERTLDGAVKAKSDTYFLEPQFGSKQAWEECMDLYEQTIHRLNESVLCPKNVCSRSDVQAWLSTALTNLDTCQEEMSELGVSSHSLESITIDVINTLAINKRMEQNGKEFGISKITMKTLSIGEKVDVVVAQDGSGDYKTIQEAVNGAGERPKGSPRYVIHVKQGVYEEYVNVGIKSNNIMITGDGIGKTIITGDKSKGRGFSTYKSATFVNTITAQSRFNPNQTTGIVIHNSVVKGAPGVQLGGVKTYLGRPWRSYARTVVIGTYLDTLIEPNGWIDWDNVTALSTLYYGEYQNSGPGSGTENRVDWAGFHVISDIQEAREFTLPNSSTLLHGYRLPKCLSPSISNNILEHIFVTFI
ncbi:unnamed protein product [Arabidopsis thaliana]|uniref:(thale cress) hypothetical protein n=1 Tax=Arabidopsis thaliana TaxID=3702 RepID=A0A7G2F069_ARATH|nr:unnamed protein product [Arabidopsis thaliana]